MSVELRAAKGTVQVGDGYAGIGVRVPSATAMFEAATAEGGKVLLEVGNFAYAASLIPDEDEMRNTPVRYGRLSDPDGYTIEIREDPKNPTARKLFKLVFNVLDIEEGVTFYRDVLGMNVLRRRSNVYSVPKDASMCAYLGYNDELTGPYLELNYNYASDKLDMGNGFMQTSFKVPNTEEVANKLMDKVLQGGSKTIEVATDNTVIVRDPSEYPILLV
jgi:catechol 2,3-dioxygenase-like lactoylglutathione lyase family enzyme